MPHVCPRPCSLLATAAVFISVGVVQFVVGIILLRSKYVYMLAGPDFWTSCCNITVGCLLGVSASVWKQSKKRLSKKHMMRRNLLSGLLFSALIINVTTLGLLILGEGNSLLSIRLENGGRPNEATFVSEVLAYAYAASVCSPIVCIVVSIVSLSGNCFTSAANKKMLDMKNSLSGMKRDSASLNWVYTPQMLAKTKRDILASSSDSSSNEEEADGIPMETRHVNTSEDLRQVLSRMALGKRDSILSDSAIMIRQMDQRRKDRYGSLVQDGSYLGPVLSRTRESASCEKTRPKSDLITYDKSPYERHSLSSSVSSDKKSCLISDEMLQTRINYMKTRGSVSNKKWRSSHDLRNGYHSASETKNSKSRYRNYQSQQIKAEINSPVYDNFDYSKFRIKDIPGVHKKTPKRPKLDIQNLAQREIATLKRKRESLTDNEVLSETVIVKSNEDLTEMSPDCFSPDSDFGGDSFDLSRTGSWAGDIVPISVGPAAGRPSRKLIPVLSPVVPGQDMDSSRSSDSAGSKTESVEDPGEKAFKNRNNNLSTFREDVKLRNKGMTEYPKVGSSIVKKYDLARVATMASISEEPNTESKFSSSEAFRYSSPKTEAETSGISNNCFKKSLSSPFSELSEDASHDWDISGINKTPKRKTSVSCKTLRRIWSSADSEKCTNFRDQVVDEDSLIGLSEEELIARQFKNRSLRKTVQQRIKNEIPV